MPLRHTVLRLLILVIAAIVITPAKRARSIAATLKPGD